MTLIFNIFVFYTLFNQINCRIIDDSINIFSRINKGFMFIIVTLCEMIIQILIVQFGSGIFHCVIGGLSFRQWKVCILLSLTTVIFSFIIKFLPIDKLINYYLEKIESKKGKKYIENIELEMRGIDFEDNKKIEDNLINT